MIFRLGELFCGAGGLVSRARMAGVMSSQGESYSIQHVWATDYDPSTCRTYAHNICADENAKTVVCADVRQLNLASLKAISDIDGLVFGFPCNDFSQVEGQKVVEGSFGLLNQYAI